MATVERGPIPTDNFTMLSNGWLRDKCLSFKARGVLSWLSSHSVGFRVSLDRIAAASDHDGVAAVRSAVQELEDAGYLVRKKERDDHGRITARAYVLQDPNMQVTANMQFSHDGETPPLSDPPIGNTTHGETAPLKKNISSKKTNAQNTTPVAPAGEQAPLVDGQGSTVGKPTARTRRRKPVSFMTEDWLPPVDWADKLAEEFGCTRDQLGAWLSEFRLYWIGQGEAKADWVAVWRNRMRTRVERGELPGRPLRVAGGRSTDAAADVLAAERAARYGAPAAFDGDVVTGQVISG